MNRDLIRDYVNYHLLYEVGDTPGTEEQRKEHLRISNAYPKTRYRGNPELKTRISLCFPNYLRPRYLKRPRRKFLDKSPSSLDKTLKTLRQFLHQ